MDTLVVIFLSGLSWGVVLFLMACGLSLTMGVMGIVNLAHGSFFMIGAYVGYIVAKQGGNQFFPIAVLAGAVAGGLVGLLIEQTFLRHLYKQPFDEMLLTIGFVYILGNIVLWIAGGAPRFLMPPPFLNASVKIGHLAFPVYRLVLIGIGLTIAMCLWWLQDKTRMGAIIRAGMDDKEMVTGLGLNYRLISSMVFFVGALLAGLAGLLGGPIVGMEPEMSWPILLLAMAVVIIGGMGSVQGALLGAVMIGLLDSFTKATLPGLVDFVSYLAFVIILLIKPAGLLGKRQI
jgi:branched-chain amino acid transport system permease protein